MYIGQAGIRLMFVRRLAAFPCRSYIVNLKYPLPQQSQVCDKIPTEKTVGLNAHAHGRFAPGSDGILLSITGKTRTRTPVFWGYPPPPPLWLPTLLSHVGSQVKTRSNDFEDIGQGQRSPHATHLLHVLVLVIICTNMERLHQEL